MAKNNIKETQSFVFGQDNVFDKTYDQLTKELGIRAQVKLHYPTIAEAAKIKAEVSRLFEGTPQDYFTSALYEMIVSFSVIDEGTKVWAVKETDEGIEKELIEDYFSVDGHPNLNLVRLVLEDFTEWQGRFTYA